MQDPNEVEKQKDNYTAAQGKDDESYSEDDGTQKKEKGRSYSMGKGRRVSQSSPIQSKPISKHRLILVKL